MSRTYLPPNQGRQIAELERRLAILERRIPDRLLTPTAAGGDVTHDGTGTNSTVLAGQSVATQPVASAPDSVAIGNHAEASRTETSGGGVIALGSWAKATHRYATAIGEGAEATAEFATAAGDAANTSGEKGTAVGANTTVSGSRAAALGYFATATHAESVALGADTETTGPVQVNAGTKALFAGCPDTAPGNALLIDSQFSVWLNEAGNQLTFKVKYSTGIVKSGTVALA